MKLYTREAGTGQPMVLLHGNGENGSYFSRQIEFFSKKYHVIAIDTRGHGKTPRGTGPFKLGRFADDLEEFLRRRRLRKIILLGFSDGANIAMVFALRYPGYIDRMILNGGNLNPFGMKLSVLLGVAAEYAKAEAGLMERRLLGKPRSDILHKRELLGLMLWEPGIFPRQLRRLKMPVLVVAGSDDMIRQRHTEKIARCLPAGRLLILKGTHFVAAEAPDVFNRGVDTFLRATQGSELDQMKRLWQNRTCHRNGNLRNFAVLIPLVFRKGEYHVLFEVRARELRNQPGEICFPGGAVEHGESRFAAAVRETVEELKIKRSQIEVIAPMDELITPAGMVITPFLGVIRGYRGTFSPDEVDRVFTVPLRWFAENEPESYQTEVLTNPGDDFPYDRIPGGRDYQWRRGKYEVLFYRFGSNFIWGMTAKMMRQTAALYRQDILGQSGRKETGGRVSNEKN